MDDYDTRILVDAKIEYTKYFIRILKKHFFEGISSLFDNALDLSNRNYNQVFMIFQDLLKDIPKWNQNTIDDETTRIMECSECEFLEDLLTAVFVSHTKILSVIRINKKNKKINLNIPKLNNFIHKCYIEIAREFWKTPTYFNNNIPATEIQKNYRICEEIISNCINETIRKLLPIKYILKESLGDDYDDEESQDSEDIQKNISSNEERNLKRLVQKEIENLYKSKEEQNNDESIIDNSTVDNTLKDSNNDNIYNNDNNDNIDNNYDSNLLTNDNLDLDINNNIDNNLNNQDKIINYDQNIIDDNKNIHTDQNNEINENKNIIKNQENSNQSNDIVNNNIKNIELKGGNLYQKDYNLKNENVNNEIKSDIKEISINSDSINNLENNDYTLSNPQNISNLTDRNNLNQISIDTNTNDETSFKPVDNKVDNDLNEIDLGFLTNNSDLIKIDSNYNVVSDNDLYNNLNNKNNIQSEVLNDLNENKKKNINFFEDAIEIENL